MIQKSFFAVLLIIIQLVKQYVVRIENYERKSFDVGHYGSND